MSEKDKQKCVCGHKEQNHPWNGYEGSAPGELEQMHSCEKCPCEGFKAKGGERLKSAVITKQEKGWKQEMYDEIRAKQNTSKKIYLKQDKTYSEYQDKKGNIALSKLFPILDKHLSLVEDLEYKFRKLVEKWKTKRCTCQENITCWECENLDKHFAEVLK